jgi:hypothetical protein
VQISTEHHMQCEAHVDQFDSYHNHIDESFDGVPL